MRTTITLDDKLVEDAKEITGIRNTPELIRTALTDFVQREASRQLALLGGSMPGFRAGPRKRYFEPDDDEGEEQ